MKASWKEGSKLDERSKDIVILAVVSPTNVFTVNRFNSTYNFIAFLFVQCFWIRVCKLLGIVVVILGECSPHQNIDTDSNVLSLNTKPLLSLLLSGMLSGLTDTNT